MALPCDIIRERDVPITLRDGTVIYTDVYLPVGGRQVPAIIAWSPYGKSVPQNADLLSPSVPLSWVSGLQKFEGPDPAFWCNHGYAVINVDVRGAFNSGGNIQYYGMVDAGDGYDVIEWAASQPWSNGKIGMAGNSWLAITQWFIAATQPPHLAAIAPWNGFSDYYRNSILQGGIPDLAFNAWLTNQLLGHNEVEDTISFQGSAVPAHGSLLEG